MTIRPLEKRDIPILEAIYNELDLQFIDGFPKGLEEAQVVVDDGDRPFMLAGVKMVPELVMICDQRPHLAIRLEGITLLHKALRDRLHKRGFKEAVSFVSPRFGSSFVSTMIKRYGWKRAWEAFRVT
jgi:hypothetical protein